ncbi:MAG TPA: glycosyltransferase [Vicinamibacterales bacterium]|nr:glycosyltransferase [Vicinamibacterales bacterium]
MVTSSYPRFPGDGIGSFVEPIAKSVAARGHDVHLVAPWHPAIRRPDQEAGVQFHFYKYAPVPALNVFGYSGGLRADTTLRGAAWMAAPFAMAAGWWAARRVAAKYRATVMHGHWVIPSGVMAALAKPSLPLVVSLHGSDVFVAERNFMARQAARAAFRRAGWVTACSDDLRTRAVAIGARADRIETVPYGVDAGRFHPDAAVRAAVRQELGIGDGPLVFTAGRLVRKKGFEYLIDAAGALTDIPGLTVVIAGDGDLRDELSARVASARSAVRLIGNRSQDEIARLCAAADVIAVPSIRDDAGNVDGLPNFAMEALASATPVVASRAGGLPQVIADGRTGRLVAERDPTGLASAVRWLLEHPSEARHIGAAARADIVARFGWADAAARFEAAYARAHR